MKMVLCYEIVVINCRAWAFVISHCGIWYWSCLIAFDEEVSLAPISYFSTGGFTRRNIHVWSIWATWEEQIFTGTFAFHCRDVRNIECWCQLYYTASTTIACAAIIDANKFDIAIHVIPKAKRATILRLAGCKHACN